MWKEGAMPTQVRGLQDAQIKTGGQILIGSSCRACKAVLGGS